METFSFRTTDCAAESIKQAAKIQGKAPSVWMERLIALAAYAECEKERKRLAEIQRRRSRIIAFPQRSRLLAAPAAPAEVEAGS